MKKNCFLENGAAERIYAAVKDLPVIDYHCHLSPREIYEDKPFESIGEIWLSADHYKWRLMRQAGIDEKYITGTAPFDEKFVKYCEALEFAAGNPLYHWSHSELDMYFGIDTDITSENAEDIMKRANEVIEKTQMSPRKLIKQTRAEVICTTDDITDDLYYHKKISADKTADFKVLPSFRTDRLLLIRAEGYGDYIKALGKASETEINGLDTLKNAVGARLDYFCENGCKCADMGIPDFPSRIADDTEADEVFKRAVSGDVISDGEYSGFLGNMLLFLSGLYKKRGLISQWHLAVVRNANSDMYAKIGPDCGGDCVGNTVDGDRLILMLDAINSEYGLPETVLYTLNEANTAQIASIAGAFENVKCGAAWWFCDHKRGIEDEIKVIAENGCLGEFYGMLTDSRSFLSYARHDYFRRILSSVLGEWVENGEYPERSAVALAKRVCCENIKRAVTDK